MRQASQIIVLLCLSVVWGQVVANPLAGIVTPRDTRQPFVELRMNELLVEPLQSSGELLYATDGTLTKFIHEPAEEVITITADKVQLERGGKVRSMPVRKAPQLAEYYAGLKALLDGDLAAIEQIFIVGEVLDGETWSVILTPRSQEFQTMATRLTVAGRSGRLEEIHIEQPEAAWQTIRIVHSLNNE